MFKKALAFHPGHTWTGAADCRRRIRHMEAPAAQARQHHGRAQLPHAGIRCKGARHSLGCAGARRRDSSADGRRDGLRSGRGAPADWCSCAARGRLRICSFANAIDQAVGAGSTDQSVLNTSDAELDVALSADGNTIVFCSDRAGSMPEVWISISAASRKASGGLPWASSARIRLSMISAQLYRISRYAPRLRVKPPRHARRQMTLRIQATRRNTGQIRYLCRR